MLDWLADNLALIMFVAMFFMIFCGYPVAFVMGGMALFFAIAGSLLGVFSLLGLYDVVLRMGWRGRRSGARVDSHVHLHGDDPGALRLGDGHAEGDEVLLKRVPGALAVAVMVMGTILAAPIGVVGAAVVTLSVIALPQMLASGYDKRLAIGTIASAGTLGILIPPAIMLVVMAEMLATSAGSLFLAATMPGFVLSGLYLLYIIGVAGSPARRQAAAGLRAADPRRVLDGGVGPVSHDGADGDRDRLDLRRLGHADRERRRRRVRLDVHCRLNRRLTMTMMNEAIMSACRSNGLVFLIFLVRPASPTCSGCWAATI